MHVFKFFFCGLPPTLALTKHRRAHTVVVFLSSGPPWLFRCAQAWLAQDPKNVAAIHCKAGKGRTGVMITAYLMYCKDWEEPEDAMAFYGFARTNNQKGITIPSQRTFIYHWDQILKSTSQYDTAAAEEKRRLSTFGSSVEEKAAILAATKEHLTADGEHDDSDSEGEGGGEDGGLDASIVEQVDQLVALRDAGHLTTAEFDEAKKQVFEAAGVPDPSLATAASPAKPPPAPGGGAAAGGGGGGGGARAIKGAAEAAGSDSEEEDDDDGKGRKKGGFFSMFGGKKKGLAKTAAAPTPKEVDPLMDRSWNDRNRAEPPSRGQIPDPALKLLTNIRMVTIPKGGYDPNFTIFCGGFKYESKDMCATETYDKQPFVDIAIPPIPLIDEVFVVFYKPGTFGKKKKMFQFWFHCSFMEKGQDVVVIQKKDMDKAIKDKKHKKYAANFALEFTLKEAPAGTQDPRRTFVPKRCDFK